LEHGDSLGGVELEAYDPSDLLRINGTEDEMGIGTVEEYIDGTHLDHTEYQVHSEEEMSQDVKLELAGIGSRVRNGPRKPKIRTKDVMELPFNFAGQTFTVQAQKLILNVYDFFQRTQEDPSAVKRIGTPQAQAAKILNCSSQVIGKVRKRFKSLGKVIPAGQRRPKIKRVLDGIDADKEASIRAIINEFSTKQ